MAAEPDWIRLARETVEAQQRYDIRRQIDFYERLLELQKAENKRDTEAKKRGAND